MTPEKKADIAERYGFAPGERDVVAAEIAERRRRIAHEEAVAWAKAQNAERAEAERQSVVSNETTEKRTVTKSEAAMTDTAQIWETWVKARIKASREASETAMVGAVADVVAIETEARQTLEAEHAVTRQELAAVKSELAELRGELKTRAALADMETRLARMETTPTPARLKTVG